jgi:hypothetical protein
MAGAFNRLAFQQNAFAVSQTTVFPLDAGACLSVGGDAQTLFGHYLKAIQSDPNTATVNAVAFKATRRLTAGTGSFTATGVSSGLVDHPILYPVAGAYAVSGVNLTFKATRTLTATAGSYSVVGASLNLRDDEILRAQAGSFSVAGKAASLFANYKLTAAAGVFTSVGKGISLLHAAKTYPIPGQYTISGVAVQVSYGHKIPAEYASFNVQGQNTRTIFGRGFIHSAGSYTIGTQPAAIKKGFYLKAEKASFSYSGLPVTLRTSRQIYPSFGQFAVFGRGAGLPYAHYMRGEATSFTSTGRPAALLQGRYLGGYQGTYTLTGQEQKFKLVRVFKMKADGALLTSSGVNVSLRAWRFVYPEVAHLNVAGQSVKLFRKAYVALSQGSYVATGISVKLKRYFPPLIAGRIDYTIKSLDARIFFSSFLYDEHERVFVEPEQNVITIAEPSRLMTLDVEAKLLVVAAEVNSATADRENRAMIAPYEKRNPEILSIWRSAA